MLKVCDLHTHSVFSDGTDTPFEIVKKAKEVGLSAVALTDHNTASGLNDFIRAGKELDFEVIGGVEFSADYIDREVHVVALYVKEEDYSKIVNFFSEFSKRKEESNRNLIKGLNTIGINLSYEKMLLEAPSGKINRANIGAELVKLGYVKNIEEAFETVLSKERGFYVEPKRPTAEETIKFINDIGAVSILAHPLLSFNKEELKSALKTMKQAGLKGIETNYSTFTQEETNFLFSLAKEMFFIESGGSDYHGANKPDIALGVGKGNLSVPYEFLEKIKKTI